jgi:protein-disulfide isomerase/uncharacterized membrane protein
VRLDFWLVALRVAALVALGASGALLVDYVSVSPAFCSPGSGCSAVRGSGYGYLFGGQLPMPAVGIAGFASLFVVSLLPSLRRWVFPMAAAGGVAAVVLLLLQAVVIRQFCFLCVIADAAAIVAMAAAYFGKDHAPGRDPFAPYAWVLFAVVAVGVPQIWPRVRAETPIPAGIASYYQGGKINVVEFADYECPFCRALHPLIKKLIAENPGKVNFVRLNMPLPRHPYALDAAKAAVCAEAQAKGDAMADQLFELEELSGENIRRIASALRLDSKAFEACLLAPGTLERIQRESKILRDAGFQGLPTTYVGARQIIGAQSEETFREAFAAAAGGDTGQGVPGWLFAAVVAAFVGGVAFLGRAEEEEDAPAPLKRKAEPERRRRDSDDDDDGDDSDDDDSDDDDSDDDDSSDDDSDDDDSDDDDSDDDGSSDDDSDDDGSDDDERDRGGGDSGDFGSSDSGSGDSGGGDSGGGDSGGSSTD